jgi:ABC-type Zn uptake system ZnuABC Zn-binding protein ZnuA
MTFSNVPSMTARFLLSLLTVLGVLIAGCGDDESNGGGGAERPQQLDVVATNVLVDDLVRNVGGDRVRVTSLMAPNADPHDYEPRPRDIKSLTDAALIFRSGGDLDDWLEDAIESTGGDAPVTTLIDSARTIQGEAHEGEGEEVDPHWWHDPRNVELAIGAIRGALAKADPDGAADYAANAKAYATKVRELDRSIARCMDQVPAAQRKLVTTHDALGYYARRYGIEVIGAVIPSLSTQGQASAGQTRKLIDTIRRERAKAVFAESSVNSKVEKAIADEAGARVGKELWADGLGAAGSQGATYLQAMASNTSALVDGFTGGAQSCSIRP